MREFLLNSEDLLDREAVAFMEREGQLAGLFSCSWIHFNDKIKLAYFTDGCTPLSDFWTGIDIDTACAVSKALLDRVTGLEKYRGEISLENIVWDPDSIYTDGANRIFLICLPAVLPPESETSGIYKKRIYSLIDDMVSDKEGGVFVSRQINYQKQKNFGNWEVLRSTLDLREGTGDETDLITIRSINTPEPVIFSVGRDRFTVGSDPDIADGVVPGGGSVEAEHAVIGWNGINHFVMDMGSSAGTYVNDQKIVPDTEVPVGEGTVLRFGEYTFNVE